MEIEQIITLVRTLTPAEFNEFDQYIGTHFLHLMDPADPDSWDREANRLRFGTSDANWALQQEIYRKHARKVQGTTWAQKLRPLFRTDAEDLDHCLWKLVRTVTFEVTNHTLFSKPAREYALKPGAYLAILRAPGVLWEIAGFNPDGTKVRLYHVVGGRRKYDYISASRKLYVKLKSLDTVYTDPYHLNRISEHAAEDLAKKC